MTKVTHIFSDVVAQRPEVVFNRPLGPLAGFFGINWRNKVSLSTSWQSDVARAKDTAAQARRRLVTRPSRSQSVVLAALSRQECLVAQNMALRHAETPSPVPMYSEVVVIGEIIVNGNEARIFGKFEKRRYHLGQRILVTNSPGKCWESPVTTLAYAVVRGASASSILIYLTDLAGNVAAFAPGAEVYPMMDCRLSLSTTGLLLTDTALEVTLESKELDGPSALPASFRGSPAGLFPTVKDGFDFSLVADGVPVLSPRIQMSRGLPKAWRRFGEESGSGKSGIIRTEGGTFSEWDISVEGKRDDIWKMLNFFDWAQGRGRSFWFSDAAAPWELIDIDPAGNYATVKATDSLDNLNAFYSHVAIVLPGEAQGYAIREVTAFTSSGANFRINWPSSLPALPYQALKAFVIPISRATFADDVFEEIWESDEVGTTAVSIVGALNEKEVIVPRWDLQNDIEDGAFGPLTDQILEDTTCWFSAGRNCFQEDIPGSNIVRRSGQWPQIDSFAQLVYDTREDIANILEKQDAPNKAMVQVGAQSSLFRYRNLLSNNNRPSILDPFYNYLPHTGFGSDLHISERHLWSPEGFTAMVCLTPGDFVSYPCLGFGIRDDSGTLLMQWVFSINGGTTSRAWVVDSNFPFELVGDTLEQSDVCVAYIRWSNGRFSCRVNNGNVSAVATPVSALPMPSGYQPVNWFEGMPGAGGPGVARENNFGTEASLNQVLWSNRPMSGDEIDAVASRWSGLYGGVAWEPSVQP